MKIIDIVYISKLGLSPMDSPKSKCEPLSFEIIRALLDHYPSEMFSLHQVLNDDDFRFFLDDSNDSVSSGIRIMNKIKDYSQSRVLVIMIDEEFIINPYANNIFLSLLVAQNTKPTQKLIPFLMRGISLPKEYDKFDIELYYAGSNDDLHRIRDEISSCISDSLWKLERRTIFLSYNSKESDLADIIDCTFSHYPNVTVSRYTRDVKYKDSFKEFMKHLKKHDFVVMLISDKFLKSQACLFEVGELLKIDEYRDKLLFIVVTDTDSKYLKKATTKKIGAKVYSAVERAKYIVYWEKKYDTVLNSINKINSDSAKIELLTQLRDLRKIIDHDLSPFLNYISDACGLSFDKAYTSNFYDLFALIKEREEVSTL